MEPNTNTNPPSSAGRSLDLILTFKTKVIDFLATKRLLFTPAGRERITRFHTLKTKIEALRPEIAFLNQIFSILSENLDISSEDEDYEDFLDYAARVEYNTTTFQTLSTYIAQGMYPPELAQIADWENTVEYLRVDMMNELELEAEDGWPLDSWRGELATDPDHVFHENWNWECATLFGGPGLDDHVAPHDWSRPAWAERGITAMVEHLRIELGARRVRRG